MGSEIFSRLKPIIQEAQQLNERIPESTFVGATQDLIKDKNIEVVFRNRTDEMMQQMTSFPQIIVCAHQGKTEIPRFLISSLPQDIQFHMFSSTENLQFYGDEVRKHMLPVDTSDQPNPKFTAQLKRLKYRFMTDEDRTKHKNVARSLGQKSLSDAKNYLKQGDAVGILADGEQKRGSPWLDGVGWLIANAQNIPNARVTLIDIDGLGAMDRRLYFKGPRQVWPIKPEVTYLASLSVGEIMEQAKKLQLYNSNGKEAKDFQKVTAWLQEYYEDLAAEFRNMDLNEVSSKELWGY